MGGVTHSTAVVVPDDPAYPVGSDEWNAGHTVSLTASDVGADASGAAAAAQAAAATDATTKANAAQAAAIAASWPATTPFDATVPAAVGTAATGAASTASHRDHVHPTGAGTPSTQAFGDAASTGTGPAAAMTDHKHGMPATPTATGTAGGSLSGTYPNPTVATNANLTGDVTSSGNATTIGAGKVTEAMQVLADNTTQDVLTTKHGYVPKLPNDATKLLNGVGAWTQNGWILITKASDESVASSTVQQADDELTFTAANGGFYDIEAYIIYASPAGAATPDLKINFGEDGTARGIITYFGFSSSDSAQAGAATGAVNNGGFAAGTAAANRVVFMKGWYLGTGAAAAIQWAQNTSGVNATVVRAGSTLRYRRVL